MVRLFFLICICLTSFGCSHKSDPSTNSPQLGLNTDGAIVISRPVPASMDAKPSMLGFLPSATAAVHSGTWLKLNLASKEIELMQGNKLIKSVPAVGFEKLSAGSYSVAHKQKGALWYAPDSYFAKRNQTVPPAGDKLRYRRGALGEFALFINKDLPVYSGPFWSEEIGGLRVEPDALAPLYYSVEIGAPVEIE